jgi:hypothetical protein
MFAEIGESTGAEIPYIYPEMCGSGRRTCCACVAKQAPKRALASTLHQRPSEQQTQPTRHRRRAQFCHQTVGTDAYWWGENQRRVSRSGGVPLGTHKGSACSPSCNSVPGPNPHLSRFFLRSNTSQRKTSRARSLRIAQPETPTSNFPAKFTVPPSITTPSMTPAVDTSCDAGRRRKRNAICRNWRTLGRAPGTTPRGQCQQLTSPHVWVLHGYGCPRRSLAYALPRSWQGERGKSTAIMPETPKKCTNFCRSASEMDAGFLAHLAATPPLLTAHEHGDGHYSLGRRVGQWTGELDRCIRQHDSHSWGIGPAAVGRLRRPCAPT